MSKPHYPTCIFCRRNDSEPSKEDVLAKWIAREWPRGKKSRFRYQTGRFGTSSPDAVWENVGNLGVVTKGPCKRCNNGWMSVLEEKAKPILKPLMRGEASTITTDQKLWIARWTIKTVIM